MFVYTIQPVVKPVVSCKRGITLPDRNQLDPGSSGKKQPFNGSSSITVPSRMKMHAKIPKQKQLFLVIFTQHTQMNSN